MMGWEVSRARATPSARDVERGGGRRGTRRGVKKRRRARVRMMKDVALYAFDGVLGGALAMEIARTSAVVATRRRESASADASDEENRGDVDLRWTVASVVGCIPLIAWCSWLLPTMTVGSWDDEGARGIGKQKANALALAYFLAYAAHGFNLGDSATWLVTIVCAAHIQLERTIALETVDVCDEIGDARGETLRAVESVSADHRAPTRSQKGKGMVLGLLNSRSHTTSNATEVSSYASAVMDETPLRGAVNVGRALGQVSVAARQFGSSVREGQIQAELEQEALRTQQALEQELEILSGELEDWDVRFRLRTLTKPQLLDVARRRGLKRFSKLTKPQLIARIEREVIEEEANC